MSLIIKVTIKEKQDKKDSEREYEYLWYSKMHV